jgi:hypothetical protein
MKRILLITALALLFGGAPALAGPATDTDGDGVDDHLDNCSDVVNAAQDDTDGDDCGNLCDADYDDSGTVGFPDFATFSAEFANNYEEAVHTEPVPGGVVGFPDFAFYSAAFASNPGPSGTTAGTLACP